MQRLHPLTGLLRILRFAVVGLSVPVFVLGVGSGVAGDWLLDWLFRVAPAGALVGAGYGLASYLRFRYVLTDESLDVHSGVLFYREREIPIERIQNVDAHRELLHRILGLAVVRIETAGGGSTEAELSFVSNDEAGRLQREIRRRRAALDREDADDPARDDAPPAEAEATGTARSPDSTTANDDWGDDGREKTSLLFSLSPTELAVYALTEFRPGAAAIAVFAYPVFDRLVAEVVLDLAGPLGGPGSLSPSMTPDEALAVGLVSAPLTILAGWILGAALGAVGYYGFTLGRRGRDLVYERGLMTRYSGAIPVGKLQTLTVSETLLQRPLGYAGLRLETAGLGADRAEQGSPSAIPLAERGRVWSFARALEGFDGTPSFVRPPKRARRRYVARYAGLVALVTALSYGVAVAVGGFERWWTPALLLPLVPVAAHLKWANRGHAVGENHLFVRTGFWRRKTTVVPYRRLQTVDRSRTPFQRRLDLAHLVADTASSFSLFGTAAAAYDVPAEDARDLHGHLRERLQASLGGRPPAGSAAASSGGTDDPDGNE